MQESTLTFHLFSEAYKQKISKSNLHWSICVKSIGTVQIAKQENQHFYTSYQKYIDTISY